MMYSHSLSKEKDIEICRLLVGWDNLEKRLGENEIIDFNLSGFQDKEVEKRYTTRLEVLTDLKKLLEDSEIKADQRVWKKIKAQDAYLRNLMGEHWDFEAYIQATMGFRPVLFTEEQIDQQRQEAEERLVLLGIKLDADTIENLNSVDEEIPEGEVAGFYKETLSRNLAALSSCIGKIPSFNFKVEFTDVDAYWQNWVSGSRKDYLLRFIVLSFNNKTLLISQRLFLSACLHDVFSWHQRIVQ